LVIDAALILNSNYCQGDIPISFAIWYIRRETQEISDPVNYSTILFYNGDSDPVHLTHKFDLGYPSGNICWHLTTKLGDYQ